MFKSRQNVFISFLVSFGIFSNIQTVFFGYSRVQHLPLINACLSVLVCSYLFYIGSVAITKYTTDNKLETTQLLNKFFGEKFSLFCLLVIICILYLWFIEQSKYLEKFLYTIYFPTKESLSSSFQTAFLFLFFSILVIYRRRALIFLSCGVFLIIIILLSYLFPIFLETLETKELIDFENLIDFSIIIRLFNNSFIAILALPFFYRAFIIYQDVTISLRTVYFVSLPFFVFMGIVLCFILPNQNDILVFYSKKGGLLSFITALYVFLSGSLINMLNLFFIFRFVSDVFDTRNKTVLVLLSVFVCSFIPQLPNTYEIITFLNIILASVVTIIMVGILKNNTLSQKGNVFTLALTVFLALLCKFHFLKVTGTLLFDAIMISILLSLCLIKLEKINYFKAKT